MEEVRPVRKCEDYDPEPNTWYHAHDLGQVACQEEAKVGWGSPARWLCLRHFERRLKTDPMARRISVEEFLNRG